VVGIRFADTPSGEIDREIKKRARRLHPHTSKIPASRDNLSLLPQSVLIPKGFEFNRACWFALRSSPDGLSNDQRELIEGAVEKES